MRKYILLSPSLLVAERFETYEEAFQRRIKIGNDHYMIYKLEEVV